jgi:hypothetical protein
MAHHSNVFVKKSECKRVTLAIFLSPVQLYASNSILNQIILPNSPLHLILHSSEICIDTRWEAQYSFAQLGTKSLSAASGNLHGWSLVNDALLFSTTSCVG